MDTTVPRTVPACSLCSGVATGLTVEAGCSVCSGGEVCAKTLVTSIPHAAIRKEWTTVPSCRMLLPLTGRFLTLAIASTRYAHAPQGRAATICSTVCDLLV